MCTDIVEDWSGNANRHNGRVLLFHVLFFTCSNFLEHLLYVRVVEVYLVIPLGYFLISP